MQLIHLLPLWYQYAIVISFGAIIGSFLNVYIYRFNTGKSLSGHSHCLSCGTRLRFFELFPLFSYLGLRGRCRTCGSGVPVRYFLVELLTAGLYLLAYLNATSVLEVLYLWLLLAILIVIVVYDIRHYIIPDSLTLSVTTLALIWMGYLWYGGVAPLSLLITVAAALGGASFFLFLWVISKGRWIGFGDVKLAFPLGLIVGAPLVFSMIALSFWIGAAISLVLVGLSKIQRGKLPLRLGLRHLTIKSVVPFAPFLIAGCVVTLFTQLNVLTLFAFIY